MLHLIGEPLPQIRSGLKARIPVWKARRHRLAIQRLRAVSGSQKDKLDFVTIKPSGYGLVVEH